MFRKAVRKEKIKTNDPKKFYRRLLKKHTNIACSIGESIIIKCCVYHNPWSNRSEVKLVKYPVENPEWVIVYSYNERYMSNLQLRERFFSKWEKPHPSINTRNI